MRKKIRKNNTEARIWAFGTESNCEISAVPKIRTLLLNYGRKQNLPRFAQLFGPNFCHISRNISPTQKILFQCTDIVPINIP